MLNATLARFLQLLLASFNLFLGGCFLFHCKTHIVKWFSHGVMEQCHNSPPYSSFAYFVCFAGHKVLALLQRQGFTQAQRANIAAIVGVVVAALDLSFFPIWQVLDQAKRNNNSMADLLPEFSALLNLNPENPSRRASPSLPLL